MEISNDTRLYLDNLRKTLNKLQDEQKEWYKDRLIEVLINLKADPETIDEVRERGLPLTIFYSPDLNPNLKGFFGSITKGGSHTLIPSGQVILSWYDAFRSVNQYTWHVENFETMTKIDINNHIKASAISKS